MNDTEQTLEHSFMLAVSFRNLWLNSKQAADSLKEANETLVKRVSELEAQVESLDESLSVAFMEDGH